MSLFDTSLLVTTGKKERATDYIPELDIYTYYWPEAKVGTSKNPFRIEIKSPSFSLHYYDEKLEWKDHSTGKQGDVFDFVIIWYKKFREIDIVGYAQANDAIWNDLKLNEKELVPRELLFTDDQLGPASRKSNPQGEWQIAVTDNGWTKETLGYWVRKYNICPGILEEYHCGHAKEVWVTPPGKPTYLWGVSTDKFPIFYFYFPRTKHIKCYAPFARKDKKWIMNCDNLTDIQGYDQMSIKSTRPELIIFTKAMKEVMFYRSFHLNAIAIHGENHRFHPDFIRHIKKYSTYQLGIYDNDRPGKHAAWLLRKDTGIPQYLIQGAKNITDLWEQKPKEVWKYIDLLKTTYQL